MTARKVALSRFIGFVEGRLGVEIPQFWERSIFTADITQQGLTVFKPVDSDMPYREVRESEKPPGVGHQMIGMISPRQASIRHDGTNWQFILGQEQFVMPRECIGSYDYERLCVYVTSGEAYLALHWDSGYSYKLVCFDRGKAAIRWKSGVWGYNEFFTNGDSSHWVAMIEANGELVVFGISADNAYIQCFRQADGEPTLRFGTIYGMPLIR